MQRNGEIATILRQAGHKLTPQRLMIVQAIQDAEGHVTATGIAERVHEDFPSVDVSTVYRTLDVLKRLGLVTVTDLGAGDLLFEWRGSEPHHHLVCSECDAIIELGHGYLEPMGQRLRADFGFEANLDHFAIFGLCRECAAAR